MQLNMQFKMHFKNAFLKCMLNCIFDLMGEYGDKLGPPLRTFDPNNMFLSIMKKMNLKKLLLLKSPNALLKPNIFNLNIEIQKN